MATAEPGFGFCIPVFALGDVARGRCRFFAVKRSAVIIGGSKSQLETLISGDGITTGSPPVASRGLLSTMSMRGGNLRADPHATSRPQHAVRSVGGEGLLLCQTVEGEGADTILRPRAPGCTSQTAVGHF
jgi:hypothetical protein